MRWLFEAVVGRVRAAILADAAGWVETRLRIRAAGRRAALLVAADRHERSGRAEVAAELRRQAGELSGDRPLAAVRAAVADFAAGLQPGDAPAVTPGPTETPPTPVPSAALPPARSRRGRG